MQASKGGIDSNRTLQDWEFFEERAKDSASLEHKRMAIADEITKKLRMYHEALLLQSRVASLPAPRKQQLKVVRSHFRGGLDQTGPWSDDPIRALKGHDYARFDAENEEDLVALKAAPDDDLLSRFFQSHGWIKVGYILCSSDSRDSPWL
ncbi:hypothetical protein PG984_009268 [Apiospora sp. TS-2023a]